MHASSRLAGLAGFAALAVGATTLADAGDGNARIAELERRLAALEGGTRMTELRAEEVRALVADVLADADTRSSMLQGGFAAGYQDGFRLQSADGNHSMKIGAQIQFRFVYNRQDEQAGVDTSRYGFENRRTKANFSGNVVDKTWKYRIQGAFDRNGGAFELEDAYVRKEFENGAAVQVGRFKAPYLREELVASTRQLAADRALVTEYFTQNRSNGVMFDYETDQWRVGVALTNGHDDANTSALDRDTEFSVHARGEFLVAGNWSQFKDFTSAPGSAYGVLLGGGVRFEKAEYGTAADVNEEETLGFTLDASVEGDGWNVFGAFMYESLDQADRDAMGFVVQGGIHLNDDWEVFGRYAYGDDDGMDAFDEVNVITVGVNRYYSGHNAKLTADLGYALDAVDGDWASSGLGWRADTNSGSDGQFVLRTQFQLAF